MINPLFANTTLFSDVAYLLSSGGIIFSYTINRTVNNLKMEIVYRNMHNLFYDILLKRKTIYLTDFWNYIAICCIFNLFTMNKKKNVYF